LGRACPAADERQATWADGHRRVGSGSHLPGAGLAVRRPRGMTSPHSGHCRASSAGPHQRGTASFHRYDAYRVLSLRGGGSVRFRRQSSPPSSHSGSVHTGPLSCLEPQADRASDPVPGLLSPAVPGRRCRSGGPAPIREPGIGELRPSAGPAFRYLSEYQRRSSDRPAALRTMRPPAAGTARRGLAVPPRAEGSNLVLTSGELGHLAHKAMPLPAAREASQPPVHRQIPPKGPQPPVTDYLSMAT
jgi:hypothetical protein